MVKKRSASPNLPLDGSQPVAKKCHRNALEPRRVATKEAAAAVDSDPPLPKLIHASSKTAENCLGGGASVVYWMRMGDLRIHDNRALSQASAHANKLGIPLIVLFMISPEDYVAHDRGPRRIDFTLRNLAWIKRTLANDYSIPLDVITHPNRQTLPMAIMEYLHKYCSKALYANVEYEVDELRRDVAVCNLALKDRLQACFVHDKCIVEPGTVLTKQGHTYTVYSPFLKNWSQTVNSSMAKYLGEANTVRPNPSTTQRSELGSLFNKSVPDCVAGFELSPEDGARMKEIFPAGEDIAAQVLQKFLRTKATGSRLSPVDPNYKTEDASKPTHTRIAMYGSDRNCVSKDTSSRLSPYLAAGVISARACARAVLALSGGKKLDTGRLTGPGVWVQEIAWRDFYVGVLAACPRVSMGRPFLEKYADVIWEDYQEDQKSLKPDLSKKDESVFVNPIDAVQKWKDGMTGYPIVDAAMRCINQTGWVHNRLRMIVAMFLTKDLMIDWRVGERYFMQNLIDGDLASNNGGWQWSASTGTDAAPYFRIFNPYSQSAKADPSGDFIRHFVPELSSVRGKDIHNPPASLADKLGYPRPIVDHEKARERAIRRFKTPGQA